MKDHKDSRILPVDGSRANIDIIVEVLKGDDPLSVALLESISLPG